MPSGWLEAPGQSEVRSFHLNPDTARYLMPEVFIDHGVPMPDQPALLKRRRRLARASALREWRELQKAGWSRSGDSECQDKFL